MADAEDAVQETYLRWHASDRHRVLDPRAFLMTTTTRICLDMLTSARARREEYVGPWLPEPVLDTAALAPDSRTELAEDLSIALLLILDQMSPLERAAFLLHDVFDFSFSEVATTLDRSETACRKLAARARAHVRALRPRGAATPTPRPGEIYAKHAQLMSAFVAATRSGDLNALTQLLASDVRIVTDGGGRVRAALDVIEGADRAARFLIGVSRKLGAWWRRSSGRALQTSTACPVSLWTHPRVRCRLRRSRLKMTSFERCTLCAIRISYATWCGRDTRAVPNERASVDSNCGNAPCERHRMGITRANQRRLECLPMNSIQESEKQHSESSHTTQAFIVGFWGVRYQVKDVQRAITFYTQTLGFNLDMQNLPAFGQVSIGGLKLILSGPGASGSRPMCDGRQQEPGGWNRVLLQVQDLPARIAELKKASLRFRNEIEVGPGGKQIQIEDPDGNPIELFEPARH